ncbi:MAG: hypothetical protein K9J06_08940 [Flavobacteriales bacterium]|nr:hypothetical protein [Flavobacteriales bacterium]
MRMGTAARVCLLFLLAVFTFDQVAMAHLLPTATATGESTYLEYEAQDRSAALPPNLKESLMRPLDLLVHFSFQKDSGSAEKVCGFPRGSSPHGLHVPIYLDHRAIVV